MTSVTRKTRVKAVGRMEALAEEDKVRDAVLEILLATGSFTADLYFSKLTAIIAEQLGVHAVLLCELDLSSGSARLVASNLDEAQNREVNDIFGQGLKDQVCELVIERGGVVQNSNARLLFPQDALLKALAAEAIVSVALLSRSRDAIGALLLVHRDALAEAPFIDAVLQYIAPRIGAELERREQDVALRRSEARLRMLTDRSKDVLFYMQVSPGLELQYISPACEGIFGMPPEAMHVGPDVLLQMMLPEEQTNLEASFESRGAEPLLARLELPDGSARWLECHDFAVKSDRLLGVGGSIRDVTRRVEAEAAVRSSEEYLRHLLDSIPDTLLLLRSDGEVLDYVPGEVDAGFGSPDEMKGRNLSELTSPAIAAVLDRITRSATRSRSVKKVQFMVPGDRPRHYDVSCLPFGGESLLLVLRDLTAQKWVEGEKERQALRDRIDERIEERSKANPYGLTYRELAVLSLVVEG
ncbi:MAG TPA: PAS domain-containing protein, partial [Dehalococcoidia bacterium]|nr:PAS domain-containing protein [Dehalococcoidia bacterium]